MPHRPVRYRACPLRLRREPSGENSQASRAPFRPLARQFGLEGPHVGELRGSGSLKAPVTRLQAQTPSPERNARGGRR
jgi:hypothetical protein